MKQILNNLFDYNTLTAEEAGELFRGISSGKYNDAQIASLVTVFLMRNPTLEELSGFRTALLEYSTPIDFGTRDYIDIVGTGGDGKDTFNISSCASVVTAAAGYKVVKHGNYGMSSISGASSVIEQHGVKFTNSADVLKRSLDECNFAYLHAPMFNTAMKAVAPVRRDMGLRTFFNMLGPLINPARPKNQLLGVFNLAMQRMYCYVLQSCDVNFAVVHSLDGYDEISLTSEFKVCSPQGEIIYSPEDLGFKRAQQSELSAGATVADAAKIFDSVLSGTSTSAQRDCVVANAAYAINVMEPQKSVEECITIAQEAIESGRAQETFKRFIELNS